MIAQSQPIALPSSSSQQQQQLQDYPMHDGQGSYTGSSGGTFNPASYTRHFLGSPVSWRGGSWSLPGSRFSVGSPTAQLLNTIDSEYRSGKTPSSAEGESIMNALNVFDREGELCRNYTCCGLQLNDLHALLEHFEEVHIVVIDPTSAQPRTHIQIPFNPTVHDASAQQQQQQQQHLQQQHQSQHHQPYSTPFDPDDMELDIDLDNNSNSAPPPPPPSSARSSLRSSPSSCAPSPPDTPISTPLSAYPSPHPFVSHHLPVQNHHNTSPYISAPSSPLSSNYDPGTAASTRQNSPTLANQHQHRPNLNLNLNVAHTGGFPRATHASTLITHPEEAFNPYARFASDYSSSMPGAQFNGAAVDEASAVNDTGLSAWHQQVQAQQAPSGGCVPPALLFASTTNASARDESSSQPHSRMSSPGANNKKTVPALPSGLAKAHSTHLRLGAATAPSTPTSTSPTSALPSSSTGNASSSATSATVPRPQPSLLLSKPFRCPKPNCNKSYKQANGLKYHMTHGSCNFAPPKDLEHVKDLLERKRREREASAGGAGLHRSASLGSVPGGSNPAGSSNASNGGSVADGAHAQTTPSTPTTPLSPTSILSLTYSDLSQIPEAELREVEREAERRLRPFACGVGECTRRYKNMNGLRYHYQHSGDHGAVGLALLASGQHECLGWGKRGGNSNNQGSKTASTGGSSIAGGSNAGAAGTRMVGLGMGGSVSMPVSRAGSVSVAGSVASSRVGTPQPAPTSTSPHAVTAPLASTSTSKQPTQQQLQQQHLAQLQAMQAHLHQQQQQHLAAAAVHQQQMQQQPQTQYQQTSPGASSKTTAITPTPVVQAQAFVVPTVVSTGTHSRQGSAGSAGSAGVSVQQQQSSPHAQYSQVSQVQSPTQSQMHTSPQQPQAQVQVQSSQQQAQQAYAVAAYSHYAQQMQRQYAQAHAQAHAQAQAQAQAAQQQQQQQAQQAEMGSQMAQDQSSSSPSAAVFNSNGEYVGEAAAATTSAGHPLSPQQQQQYAQVQMSSPTMGSPTHAHMMHQSPPMSIMGSPHQQPQQQQYDQQHQQQYHQYGMNGVDVSSLYAQQQQQQHM